MYTKMQYQNENTTSQISPSVTECGFLPQVDKIKSAKVFPSVATVKENYEKNNREQIIPFSELLTDVVYHMYNVQSLRTKDGRTLYFAEFVAEYDEHDEYYKAWIPKSLLKKFLRLEAEECWMVKNKGKRYISNNIERTYWTTTVEPIDTEFILSRIS